MYMYINYYPPVIIHFPPFISHLKMNIKVLLKQKPNHFIIQSLSNKGFHLVREMQECTTDLSK